MEQILEILFGNMGDFNMSLAPLAIAGIGAGISALGGIFGSASAGRAARRASRRAAANERKLNAALASRQEVINPYAGVEDLSAMITNPFANLQVATEAAELQAEETDLSLASTLDTLRATGAGAGGATALAQAAARSKAGISANIAQQEAQNARLRAQGEAQAQQQRMAEAQRLQQADILGQTFMFDVREQRNVADISRFSAMMQGAQQQYQDARASQGRIIGSALGSAGNILGSFAASQTGGGGGMGSAPGPAPMPVYAPPMPQLAQTAPPGGFATTTLQPIR
mgnify:CR=1 FL=1